jgi:hypothetical protein
VSLRGAAGDEAISVSGKDCFAEPVLSAVEGLAMTRCFGFFRQPLIHVEGRVRHAAPSRAIENTQPLLTPANYLTGRESEELPPRDGQ